MRWFSEKLINANIFTTSQGYPRMSVDADDYEGQTLLIIGRGKFIASLLLIPIISRSLLTPKSDNGIPRLGVTNFGAKIN